MKLRLLQLLSRRGEAVLATFASPHAGGRLLRRLLPAAALVAILATASHAGAFRLGDRAGFGELALVACGVAAVGVLVLGWIAAYMERVEAACRVTLAHVPATILIADPAGRLTYVSPHVAVDLGYEVAEAYALETVDRLVGRQMMLRLAAAGMAEIRNLEHRTVDKHGRSRVLLIDARPVSIGAGTHLFCCRDITAQKQVEAESTAQRRFSDHLVNTAPVAIVSLSSDGIAEYINPAASGVTGYDPEEVIGRNWWRLLYPDDEYEQVERLMSNSDNFKIRDYEMTLTTKSGGKRIVAWNSANLLDAYQRVTKIIGIGRDVTEQRLLQDELRQSQKMEAIGRLAGGVAHDFNNLLTIILGNAELVADAASEQGPAAEALDEITAAAERAASLTRQLLGFSRRQACKPQVVDLNETVACFLPLVERLIGENIDVLANLAPQMESVLIDPGQFEQILLNLAVNSRDAMPQGGRLTFATERVDLRNVRELPCRDITPGFYVSFSVSDTGTGMPPDVVRQIFEPFFTTKPEGQGTGMGLAMVYGVVKQHGGFLAVESEVGRGTTIRIYFPPATSDERAVAEETVMHSKPERTTPTSALVVEDNSSLCQVIQRTLALKNIHAVGAESGEDGLALAAGISTLDLLVTDVTLHGMTGIELANQLRLVYPNLKVILISGYDKFSRLNDEKSADGQRFLQKPFSLTDLLAVSTELLESESPQAALA